jgi:exopolysaccharide production protein ExoQ
VSFYLALLVCATGVAGLFWLDRDQSVRNSRPLWLPVIWLWIIGSRPISSWLSIWTGGGSGGVARLDAQLDGSPVDAIVFFALLIAGIAVLAQRKQKAGALLRATVPILIFFSYTLASVLWSPFPEVAFKRWTKDVGELAMVFIIVTEAEPMAALRTVFARVGFVLLPASILLIRYSDIGRGYDPDGHPMNTGVTTNKNTLGLITFVVALGAVWSLLHILRQKKNRNRMRHLAAKGALLAFGLAVLYTAHSATSIACFSLGALLILATNLPFIRRRPARIHALVATILVSGAVVMLFGGESVVVGALGRDTTLTGRTEIWSAVIPMCPNALLGAGFESFWNGYGGNVQGLSKYQRGINSSHNGYIEVYLNLGWVGISLIAFVLFSAYWRSCAAYRRNPEIGGILLAYVATTTIYSVTEAGFRILTPTWISLLLATVAGTAYATGLAGDRKKKPVPISAGRMSPFLTREESPRVSPSEKFPAFHRL